MHQAESSSSLSCLWTGHSLPAALHPVSRRRSCLRLRTDQCFCPIGTFTLLLVRTFRRTIPGTSCLATIVQSLRDEPESDPPSATKQLSAPASEIAVCA